MVEKADKNPEKTPEKLFRKPGKSRRIRFCLLKCQEKLAIYTQPVTLRNLLEILNADGLDIHIKTLREIIGMLVELPPPGYQMAVKMVRVGEKKTQVPGYSLIKIQKYAKSVQKKG